MNPFLNFLSMNKMLNQVKNNPVSFLAQKRLNVPQDIANDPNAILQHLLRTGKITQAQVNNCYQQLKQFGM